MRPALIAILLAPGACGSVAADADAEAVDAPSDGSSGADGSPPAPDSPPPACDLVAPFDPPMMIGAVSSTANEVSASLTPDERKLYFVRETAGTSLVRTTLVSTRASTGSAFGSPGPVGGADATFLAVSISGDDRTVFVMRTTVADGFDVFRATRPTPSDDFGMATPVDPLNSPNGEERPFLVDGGRAAYFASDRGGDWDLFRAPVTGDSVGVPVRLDAISEVGPFETNPVVTADELTIYFQKGNRILVAQRAQPGDRFGDPLEVTELTSPNAERPMWLSADGCRIYFVSDRPGAGALDVYVAAKPAL